MILPPPSPNPSTLVDALPNSVLGCRLPPRACMPVPLVALQRLCVVAWSWRPSRAILCVQEPDLGCHESQNSSPPTKSTMAMRRPPSEIDPWRGPARGFSFEREVQPVLDKYCVGCHDGRLREDRTLAADLRGRERITDYTSAYHFGGEDAGHFSTSYVELHRFVRRPGLESDYHLLTPMEFHADTTELMQLLNKGHYGVQLDGEAWDRLITWIDLNAPFHGTWKEIAGAERVNHLAQRRRDLRRLYADMHDDPEMIPNVPHVAVSPFVPEAATREAREPVACPGWPFDAVEAKRSWWRRSSSVRRTPTRVTTRPCFARCCSGAWLAGWPT